jgi:hypothetical protein
MLDHEAENLLLRQALGGAPITLREQIQAVQRELQEKLPKAMASAKTEGRIRGLGDAISIAVDFHNRLVAKCRDESLPEAVQLQLAAGAMLLGEYAKQLIERIEILSPANRKQVA